MIRYALLAAGAAFLTPTTLFAQGADGTSASQALRLQALEAELAAERAARQESDKKLARIERELAAMRGPVSPPPLGQAAKSSDQGSPPHPTCSLSANTPTFIVSDPKAWSNLCLPADSNKPWQTYDRVDVGLELLGSKTGSMAEIAPRYTTRWRRNATKDGKPGFVPNYIRVRLGARAPFDEGNDKAATFADLTKFERASGVTGVFGVEWGNSRFYAAQDKISETEELLDQAWRDCAADTSKPSGGPFKGSQVQHPTPQDIKEACEGDRLTRWMQKNRESYYDKIVRPLFADYRGDDEKVRPAYYFLGAEGSYSNSTYEFLPLSDPGQTGTPVLTGLPADFPGGDQSIKRDLYALKIYGGRGVATQEFGGTTILEAGDLSASLTYRRDFTFPSGTASQQVCAPSDLVIRCFKKNIAPPVQLKGFVAGARVAGLFPGFGFLPRTAVELKGTYDFELNRYGVQLPIYMVAPRKGAPNGGVQFSCTGSGETPKGAKLSADCKAAIFVGSDFKLDSR